MKRELTFKLPNRLITDARLSPSARKLAAALYAHRSALGFCRKSLDSLAALSGLCPATVRKAVDELERFGYLAHARTFRYLPRKRRVVYGPTAYQLSLRFQGGYTLVSRSLLEQGRELTPAAFLVCLCLLRFAGNRRRAFPSIAQLHRAAGLARSTVCRVLRRLKAAAWLLVLLCRKRTGAFAANSYHFTTCGVPARAQRSGSRGERRDSAASELSAKPEARDAQLVPTTSCAANTPVPAAGLDKERGLGSAPAASAPEDTARSAFLPDVLHAFIVKLRRAAGKFFSTRGVVPFLANKVKT